MAATDLLVEVGDPGSATTLSSPGYTSGSSTSINIASTSNWPSTGKAVIFAIDEAEVVDGEEVQVAGTYNEYEGTVASATSVSNVAWQRGSGDRNYSAGSLTRVYIPVSAERENRLVEWGEHEHDVNGNHDKELITDRTADTTPALDDLVLTSDTSASSALKKATVANLLKAAYPVGSIYINATSSTNPGTLLGFGTWTAFGAGRVLVGLDSGDTDFDTAEETGGHKETEQHNHTVPSAVDGGGNTAIARIATGGTVSNNSAGQTTNAGSGDSGNLQPYIVVYMWKRTA